MRNMLIAVAGLCCSSLVGCATDHTKDYYAAVKEKCQFGTTWEQRFAYYDCRLAQFKEHPTGFEDLDQQAVLKTKRILVDIRSRRVSPEVGNLMIEQAWADSRVAWNERQAARQAASDAASSAMMLGVGMSLMNQPLHSAPTVPAPSAPVICNTWGSQTVCQ